MNTIDRFFFGVMIGTLILSYGELKNIHETIKTQNTQTGSLQAPIQNKVLPPATQPIVQPIVQPTVVKSQLMKDFTKSKLIGVGRLDNQIKDVLQSSEILSEIISDDIIEGNYSGLKIWVNTYIKMFIRYPKEFDNFVKQAGYSENELNEKFTGKRIQKFRKQNKETLEVLQVFQKSLDSKS